MSRDAIAFARSAFATIDRMAAWSWAIGDGVRFDGRWCPGDVNQYASWIL